MAQTAITYAYAADIVKAERDPETGNLMVYGKATGPDLDLDGQIADPDWLAKAMPEWARWGNVREMHQPLVAGVGRQLDQNGEDWMVLSECVDPGAAKKIEAGAYKGYSIGIKNASVVKDVKAPGGRIVGGDIVEISYVDRPCNPTAKMAIAKSAGVTPDGGSVEDGADPALQPVEPAAELADKADPEGELTPVEPVVPAPAVDADKAVKVERGKRAGASLLRQLHAVVPADVIKAAPAEDIASAQDAIAAVARLIASEAESLAMGEAGDAYQISLLLDAICALRCFQQLEATEGAIDGSDVMVEAMSLAVTSDVTKSSTVDTSNTSTTNSTTDELIKAAVTEASKAYEGRMKALEAELAKVKALPRSGGPVLARPRATIADAGKREITLAEAERYEFTAKQYDGVDPQTAAGYRELAAKARASLPA